MRYAAVGKVKLSLASTIMRYVLDVLDVWAVCDCFFLPTYNETKYIDAG